MKRPKPNLYIRILNIVSFVIIAGSFVTVFVMWNSIPNQIPTHFNIAGQIDEYGDKIGIFVILCMGLFFYIFISILYLIVKSLYSKFKVKEENRETVYQIFLGMIVTIKLNFIIIFSIIAVFMIILKPIPSWFMEIFPFFHIGTIIFFLILLFVKTKNKQ